MSKIVSKEVQEFINKNLSEDFFKNNALSRISAYSILDVTVSVNEMDEEIYRQLPEDKKKEIQVENKRVEEEEDIDKLYNMLRKGLNPSTVGIIREKLMKHKEEIIPRFVQDLKRSGNDNFVESAARILIKSKENCSEDLANTLSEIKYPYTQSVVCYVIGKIGNEEHIETLYDYFQMFKKNYKKENYYEGPLLGLYELKRRYEF